MEHSTAILEGAKATIEAAAKPEQSQPAEIKMPRDDGDEKSNNHERRKRKADFHDRGNRHGSRGGRNDNKRHKKGDMGRGEYFASNPDKRRKNEEAHEKRLRDGAVGQGIQFSKEEIDAEERKPKRKVAVMIGYSGTGYKGMQISGTEKTIEGDLFHAFIKAGAISKANAEDPKKSSLVRCARTDKGVHAAGNMISLKLIVEEDDIVEKINANLSPQIRVWGIERTIGSFSCYQACDSRWYEYLIPSHAFLPPHPSSWLAKEMEAAADEVGDREGYESRQEEVRCFWKSVDEQDIQVILETIDEDIRWEVVKALQGEEEASAKTTKADAEQVVKLDRTLQDQQVKEQEIEEAEQVVKLDQTIQDQHTEEEKTEDAAIIIKQEPQSESIAPAKAELTDVEMERIIRLRAATKRLRHAYISAKRRYRIPQQRIERIQQALNNYLGTKNFHNYTIQKSAKDPSAKRHIKSFVANKTPILIGDGPDEEKTEWLSLKIHGQSFMMHQIRKMVGMITLLVRSGGKLETMNDSFTETRFSIPKVPGSGLLLERPVFDSYNNMTAAKHGREKLDFSKYNDELQAFKERQIYQHIFREEEKNNEFGRFFNHVDNFKDAHFLYVTSKGVGATKAVERKMEPESEDEAGGDDQ